MHRVNLCINVVLLPLLINIKESNQLYKLQHSPIMETKNLLDYINTILNSFINVGQGLLITFVS